MSLRRVKGEGSVFQKCEARYGCPPKVNGIRPDHKCKGRWFYEVDLGYHGAKGARRRDRRTVSAPSMRELRPKMRDLDTKLRAGINADGSATLEWWLDWWLEEIAPVKARSPRTIATYKGYIKRSIAPHIGHVKLDRLRPDHLRGLYRTLRQEGKAPATIKQVHAILSGALKVAENDGKILRSPARSVTLPKEDGGSHGRLTIEEARKVMKVLANRPDRARWYAALLLAMRQGEALGLAWDDVDFNANVIYVRHSLGKVPGKGLVLGPLKSKASRRVLPLLPEVKAALADVPRDGLLIWGPKDNKTDWKAWQALLKSAGVEPHPLHAARATTASLLAEANVQSKLIAEILGHAQTATTEDNYIDSDLQVRASHLSGVAGQLTANLDDVVIPSDDVIEGTVVDG